MFPKSDSGRFVRVGDLLVREPSVTSIRLLRGCGSKVCVSNGPAKDLNEAETQALLIDLGIPGYGHVVS